MRLLCSAWIIAGVLLGSATASDVSQDRGMLLAMHVRERQAHLKGDSTLLIAEMADHVVDVQNGKVEIRTRDEMRQRFSNYFHQVKYSSWDDVVAPTVRVSPDGQMAWVVIHVKAHLSDVSGPHAGQPREFESSWISIYEKRGGDWQMVGISSGVEDAK